MTSTTKDAKNKTTKNPHGWHLVQNILLSLNESRNENVKNACSAWPADWNKSLFDIGNALKYNRNSSEVENASWIQKRNSF